MCGHIKYRYQMRALRGEELEANGVKMDIVVETVEEALVIRRQARKRANQT
jgi:hypothetical protein